MRRKWTAFGPFDSVEKIRVVFENVLGRDVILGNVRVEREEWE